ncbi:Na+/H+ antiporter subunit E [Bacillus sp. V3B]|uniref:Na+/H+ antiporter subunit E n=1 Tax=Bacillus sp. V3B TaxID=2804915 RepID=UPI00210B033F|nr:Na+/H+ antiporter subunit E [Bacillus sp. V3B]MCQ6273938.1 Na+/H+ antiporter subunit E [Bacillus sp. V3B]
MPIQLLINLSVALLWMFFQDQWSVLSFFSGYLVGVFIVFSMRRFFPTRFYLLSLLAILKLILVFIRELISSSLLVVQQVIRPKINITPGIFSLETELEDDLEITLLSLLISLTPGSVVMEVSDDAKVLYIHAMDIPESSNAVIRSKNAFEKAIKEVTRYV